MYPKFLTMNCGFTVFVSCDYTGNNTKALDLDFLVVQETESGGRSGGKLSSRLDQIIGCSLMPYMRKMHNINMSLSALSINIPIHARWLSITGFISQNYFLSPKWILVLGPLLLFSSPKLKAQVSFSDHNLSVVGRHCQCKFFTFLSSSPEPLGQFQSYLAQSILGLRGFKFGQIRNHSILKRKIMGFSSLNQYMF